MTPHRSYCLCAVRISPELRVLLGDVGVVERRGRLGIVACVLEGYYLRGRSQARDPLHIFHQMQQAGSTRIGSGRTCASSELGCGVVCSWCPCWTLLSLTSRPFACLRVMAMCWVSLGFGLPVWLRPTPGLKAFCRGQVFGLGYRSSYWWLPRGRRVACSFFSSHYVGCSSRSSP